MCNFNCTVQLSHTPARHLQLLYSVTLVQSHPAQPCSLSLSALHLDHLTSCSTTCRHFFPLGCTCGAHGSPAYLCSRGRTPCWTCSELWNLWRVFCGGTRWLSFTVGSLLCVSDFRERHAAYWTFAPCVLSPLSLFKHVTLCGSTEWESPPHTHFAAAFYPPPSQVRDPPSTVTPRLVYLN